MEPVSVHNGVYAFIDMVGSTGISKRLSPRDYVNLLDYCHEIAAENAGRFGCRMGNIVGDGVVFQNVFVFDPREDGYHPSPQERLMLMTLMLSSVINGIHQLAGGCHAVDREKQVHNLIKSHRIQLGFRAGMSQGRAIVGPVGSQKRKIITAIGETVDLASRLESCGAPNHIHTTKELTAQLQEARISQDTMWIYKAAKKIEGIRQWNHRKGFSFLDFYKTVFRIAVDPVFEKETSQYKEFSASDTRLIRCLPETGSTTCAGI
jgi:class 3 adenylate cyclase